MSIQKSDPRLTQYALGEMDARESAAFEKELAGDPAAAAEVEAIRATAALVGRELAGEPAPALRDAQRSTVTRAAGRHFTGLPAWFTVAAAACLVWAVVYAVVPPTERPGMETTAADSENLRAEARSYVDRERDSVQVRQYDHEVELVGVPGRPDELVLQPQAKTKEILAGEIDAPEATVATLVVGTPAPAPRLRGRANLEVLGEVERLTRSGPEFDTEGYDRIRENPFVRVTDEDTSTFSIDVDTASYANVRRFLVSGRLPPKDAVRVEELVNYFRYDYAPPPDAGEHPFRAHVEVAACPWNAKHRLARVALKGKEMRPEKRPATNFVFLVDVSGSMRPQNKLPLLKQGLQLLVHQLDEGDKVAIVVYAGAAGLVLPPTACDDKATILGALNRLQSGGSTNGGAGIQLAYKTAKDNFVEGGVNRVILCTDGDFNVGVSNTGALTRLVEEEAKSNVFLSILGFGTGNLKDDRMEQLSNKGNGNYYYIDTIKEARKVLVEELTGTLVTIAKDVKIQVFFNPARVAGYRLVGYENRMLAKQDFNDDTKDAGEIGAGHTVTALYEIVPAGAELPGPKVDENPYVAKKETGPAAAPSNALFTLRLRYKAPEGDKSTLMEQEVVDPESGFEGASDDYRWAASVAAFGMLLRDSAHRGGMTWGGIHEIAAGAKGADRSGYRAEFLDLVQKAKALR